MTIKKIDSNFDIALWIIFLALCVGSWFLSEKICAPEYEYVDNPIVKAYTFNSPDGDVVESEYEAYGIMKISPPHALCCATGIMARHMKSRMNTSRNTKALCLKAAIRHSFIGGPGYCLLSL